MYIDLFAGCGGLSYGLYKAGLQGLFAVEKNKSAFETLKHNLIDRVNHYAWPDWLPVESISIEDLLDIYRNELDATKDSVDIIVGGPPCQGFSLAGKRKTRDKRNQLYNSYLEMVQLVEPKMLFFENVHGFTIGFTSNYKGKEKRGVPYSKKLVKALKKQGYDVAFREVLMSEYGVPQNRRRFILFAIRDGKADCFFDRLEENRNRFLQECHLNVPVTIDQAISDLEKTHGTVESQDTRGFQNGVYGPIASDYQQLSRNNVDYNNVPDSHRFARHRKKTVDQFTELMEVSDEVIRVTPKMGLVDGLKKRSVTPLKRNCVCPTITSIPDDYVHYSEPRIMTVRECARIQSFPDDYVFCGNYTTGGKLRKIEVPRYTQVANAVPPLFAEQVGNVLREMQDEDRD